LILQGDDGDTLAGGVYEWKCGETLDHGRVGNLDIGKSGQLESGLLPLERYVSIRVGLLGLVMDVDTYT
jgi:hypothetical protein